MPGNRKIVFMGVSSLEHICTSNPNPRNKMTYDCLRGFGSLHDFARLGVENTFVPAKGYKYFQVQRLAPQEKNNPQFFMRPPHRPSSIDRT